MRHLLTIIAAAVLLTALPLEAGCKKHSGGGTGAPPVDWSARPACAVQMPPPSATWPGGSDLGVYLDGSQVLTYEGMTVPPECLALSYPAMQEAYEAWNARYPAMLPAVHQVTSLGDADVVLALYYALYTTKAGSGQRAAGSRDVEYEQWLRGRRTLLVVLTPSEAKAMLASGLRVQLPERDANYNAVVYLTQRGGTAVHAVCLMNTAAAVYYATTTQPAENMRSFVGFVAPHEEGHWRFGFSDDIGGTIASFMSYRAWVQWPTPCDLAVIEWLYPSKQGSGVGVPPAAQSGDRNVAATQDGIDCRSE